MIYITNGIQELNKQFGKTFEIRNSMPNYQCVLTLISKEVIDKEDGNMKYPIYMFRSEQKLNTAV